MPLPDPYLNEPAVQVNPDLVREWMATVAQIEKLQAYADDLKASLIKQIGDANAGKIGDKKVITHRPENRYAVARLMKERGDLAQHFMRKVEKEEFDLDSFKVRHPDVAEEYRVRSFRLILGKDDD